MLNTGLLVIYSKPFQIVLKIIFLCLFVFLVFIYANNGHSLFLFLIIFCYFLPQFLQFRGCKILAANSTGEKVWSDLIWFHLISSHSLKRLIFNTKIWHHHFKEWMLISCHFNWFNFNPFILGNIYNWPKLTSPRQRRSYWAAFESAVAQDTYVFSRGLLPRRTAHQ